MCIRDRDIAEFVGLSEKNISVRLTRIREKMKQYLIEREVVEQHSGKRYTRTVTLVE